MRKNIALLALEGEEVAEDQENVRVEPEEIQEMAELDKDIETDQMVIEETEETAEAIGGLAEKVEEQSDEEGEGISPETAEAVEVAVEHFCQRVGYSRKKISLATESFATDNRKQKSIQLAKDLRIAQEHLNKQLSIAQEGLWDKIKNKVDRVFTTRRTLIKQLEQASKQYDAKGQKEGVISGKYLSVYLNPDNKLEASGMDVVANLENIVKLYDGADTVQAVDRVTKLADKLIDLVVKNKSNPTGKELSEIAKLSEELNEKAKALREIFEKTRSKTAEADLATCDKSAKEKIVALCKKSIINVDFDKRLETMYDKLFKLEEAIDKNYVLDSQGVLVSEVSNSGDKIVSEILDDVMDAGMASLELDTMAFNVAHSAVRYIELSTAK